jgi:excisionase family DNA binding protein
MGTLKPFVLPDGFADIGHVTLPEFMPDQSTMARFDADPSELCEACDRWLRIVFRPPKGLEEPYYDFDALTQSLMLWASRRGLGDGWQLADAATATYRHEPIGQAVWRAQAFIDLMKNHSQVQPTAAADGQQPAGPPKLVDSRYAAREVLHISERTLWTLTEEGAIPCVRVGRSVRYNLETLRKWIEANEQHGEHRQR